MAIAIRIVNAKEFQRDVIKGKAYCWSCLKDTSKLKKIIQVRIRNVGCKTDFFLCEECAKALLINLEKVVK